MSVFGENKSQSVHGGSVALQAEGNITIKNGLSLGDVKTMFDVLFENQFPKMYQIAKEQAIKNRQEFEAVVIQDLRKEAERIVIEKLQSPDVQASLNDALMQAARCGKKSNPELLSKLVVGKMSNGNSDLIDIVLTEAINVTPKLTRNHISLICGLFVLKHLSILDNPELSFLEIFHRKFEEHFGVSFNLSQTDITHMSFVGVCIYNKSIIIDDPYVYARRYNQFGESNLGRANEKLKLLAPTAFRFIDNICTRKLGNITLTSVGIAIAITALNELKGIDNIKYATFL